jgi:hypothetical protein
LSSIEGTADRGALSERDDWVRMRPGLGRWTPGGDEERMPVLEVGTGVGYLRNALEAAEPIRACLLAGRGSPGEEDRGSKGGRRLGAERFVPVS